MPKVGLIFNSEIVVSASNTALGEGSGDMDVFATPAMVALMENAAMNAVAGAISEEESTVGSMIDVSHLRPSPIGATIRATAEVVEVEGRKLTFKVVASDEAGVIGEGRHIRYVVNRDKFLSKI